MVQPTVRRAKWLNVSGRKNVRAVIGTERSQLVLLPLRTTVWTLVIKKINIQI